MTYFDCILFQVEIVGGVKIVFFSFPVAARKAGTTVGSGGAQGKPNSRQSTSKPKYRNTEIPKYRNTEIPKYRKLEKEHRPIKEN